MEAKKVAAKDAADKVVGQLLKYYAHARHIGHKGLERLRAYAATSPEYKLMSLPAAMGVDSEPEAAKLLAKGNQLKPWQIELVIVFDEPAPKLELRLRLMIEQLTRDFGLHFRCFVTCDGAPRELWPKQLADQGEIDMPYPAEWEQPYRQQQLVDQWKAEFPGEFDGMSENPEMGKLALFAQYALMVQLRKRYGIRSLTWYEFERTALRLVGRAQRPDLATGLEHLLADPHFVGALGLGHLLQLCDVLARTVAIPHRPTIVRQLQLHLELAVLPPGCRVIAVEVNHARSVRGDSDIRRNRPGGLVWCGH